MTDCAIVDVQNRHTVASSDNFSIEDESFVTLRSVCTPGSVRALPQRSFYASFASIPDSKKKFIIRPDQGLNFKFKYLKFS